MTKSILILDDRKTFVERLTEVLRLTDSTFEIVECLDVDTAWREFNSRSNWDVVVIDLMVPPGELFQDVDTGSGLNTGQIFAQRIVDSDVNFTSMYIHSSRNKGVGQDLVSHPKVKELPKSEYSNVDMADIIVGNRSV